MKAQAAFEFMVLFSFFLLVFLVFAQLLVGNEYSHVQESNYALGSEVARTFAVEFDYAALAGDGYFRELGLPKDIYGHDYELYISNGSITLAWSPGPDEFQHYEATLADNVSGSLPTGRFGLQVDITKELKIKNSGGVVNLAQ
ncbi:MAG: hypothetical protein NT157_01975 [Candidatus Micrarchaeota archaeon]|nr:hypothetical protein [Candidatus Micrarchaeota archaeon]